MRMTVDINFRLRSAVLKFLMLLPVPSEYFIIHIILDVTSLIGKIASQFFFFFVKINM